MDIKKYDDIVSKLEVSLKHGRFVHTMGVAYTSAALAMRYGYDVEKALVAGLLHDCAKCFPDDEKYRLCKEGGIKLNEVELKNSALVHAKLGVYIAQRDYGVTDPEILDAIRTHTTGEPAMSTLQKIVYVADLIEPKRDGEIKNIEKMRLAAFEELDKGVGYAAERMLEHLTDDDGHELDPMTRATYDYYKTV